MKLFASVLLLAAALVACDTPGFGPSPPPAEPPLAQTRVVALRFDPDTVAVGDTMLVHVVIRDSLDARFRYQWGMANTLPVDGRADGPRTLWVAPEIGGIPGEVKTVGAIVYITNDVPGTRGLTYSFEIPVLTPPD